MGMCVPILCQCHCVLMCEDVLDVVKFWLGCCRGVVSCFGKDQSCWGVLGALWDCFGVVLRLSLGSGWDVVRRFTGFVVLCMVMGRSFPFCSIMKLICGCCWRL